ncbi:MAG: YjgN family protein [Verrucomicrobiota bacterium]
MDVESTQIPDIQKNIKPNFSGTPEEYFRIWIVNTLLTIVTLGFYLPWAKVRTRRYFYLNTSLDGEPFDYLADPKKLFWGYVIVAVFLIAYNFLPTINPIFVLPVFIIGLVGFPWVIYKSRRFFCHNSAYRNIRFHFSGELSEAYTAYIAFPIVAGLTLGIMLPHVFFKQKEYFFANVSYGNIHAQFSGRVSYFYKVYLIAAAVVIAAIFLLPILIAGASSSSMNTDGDLDGMNSLLMATIITTYLTMFVVFQYVNVLITNHCWKHTRFPNHLNCNCSIKPSKYIWIQATNIVAIVLSLGLLVPWAKIRLYRYRISCFHVQTHSDLEEVAANLQSNEDGATGEMAADQFDFEIGL